MSTQLPEKKGLDIPDRDTQINNLLRKLAGHQAFARCRGELNTNLTRIGRGAGSPSEFLKEWDRMVADARILLYLLNQYERDGWTAAAEELREALTHRTYLLPGEEQFPLDQTRPVTVAMLDPQRATMMIRWAMETTNPYSFLKGLTTDDSETSPETERLFVNFPALKELSYLDFHNLCDLFKYVYFTDLANGFPEANSFMFQEDGNANLKPKRFGTRCVDDITFAGIFLGDQAELLQRFSRDQQDRIATWRFDLPTALLRSGDWPPFGFHPENEHDHWGKRYPAGISRGVSHGWGCVFGPRECEYKPANDGKRAYGQRDDPFRFTLKGSMHVPNP